VQVRWPKEYQRLAAMSEKAWVKIINDCKDIVDPHKKLTFSVCFAVVLLPIAVILLGV
jgi:hypothetical protein